MPSRKLRVPVKTIVVEMLLSVATFLIISHSKSAAQEKQSPDPVVQNATQEAEQGRQVFRFDTFGDQAFWGDKLKLHAAIEGAALGVGAGASPTTAPIGLVASAAIPALAGSSGTWATTGSLNTARSGHTATLLPSGQVLVAGGCCDASGDVLASAELYDPATGEWTVTDSMPTARWGHSATRLSNGEVLVAGGSITSGIAPTATAELYNPSTGKWTTTGSMTNARCFHGAALLGNGQVLVAGGDSTGTAGTMSAELYNPSTGQWTVTGSMVISHIGAQAARLQDGRVLMAGGTDSDFADIYSNGHWTLTSASNYAHQTSSTALLTNGDVLVNVNEFYDPANDTWVKTGPLGIQGFGFGPLMRLLSHKVLLAGRTQSTYGRFGSTGACGLYDASTNS